MPSAYRVSRTVRVEAPPAAVFPHLSDLRRWTAWSPWEGMDPHMVRTYSGTQGQVGSGYAWNGNRQAGEGSMTVTGLEPSRRVDIDLHFTRPFPADNVIRLDVDPESEGSASVVTWTMSGEHGRLMGVLSRFMPMEKMVGQDFEKGLAQLKAVVEEGQGAVG